MIFCEYTNNPAVKFKYTKIIKIQFSRTLKIKLNQTKFSTQQKTYIVIALNSQSC